MRHINVKNHFKVADERWTHYGRLNSISTPEEDEHTRLMFFDMMDIE